jgi:hypothetical protein
MITSSLLKLPNEIFDEILAYAILARGRKRGLRLRLVCSTLCFYVYPFAFLFLFLFLEGGDSLLNFQVRISNSIYRKVRGSCT